MSKDFMFVVPEKANIRNKIDKFMIGERFLRCLYFKHYINLYFINYEFFHNNVMTIPS